MSDRLSPEARAIVARGRQIEGAPTAHRDAVGDALMARLGLPPVSSPPAPPAPGAVRPDAAFVVKAAVGASKLGALVAKLAVVTALAGAGAAAGWHAARARGAVSGGAVVATAPRGTAAQSAGAAERVADRVAGTSGGADSLASAAAPLPRTPVAAPRRAPSRVEHGGTTAAQGARAPDSFTDEISLVRGVHTALRNHQPARALELLDEYGRRFARGSFREEGTVTRVLALCELGRVGEARAIGRRYLARRGGSVYADRVRASCANRVAIGSRAR